MEHVTLLINIHERSTEPATFYKAYTLRIHVAVSVCSMLHVAKSWTCSTFGNMYPNRSTCRQIQDFVAGYKIHVARYKIHAGYMLPATCIRQHVASVYRALVARHYTQFMLR